MKAYISLNTVRISKRLSLYDLGMINDVLNVLVNYALLTENHKFLEYRQTSVLTFGYPGFQKKKRFCDKLIFKTRVKIFVMTNFRGNRTDTCFGKTERRKTMKLLH